MKKQTLEHLQSGDSPTEWMEAGSSMCAEEGLLRAMKRQNDYAIIGAGRNRVMLSWDT